MDFVTVVGILTAAGLLVWAWYRRRECWDCVILSVGAVGLSLFAASVLYGGWNNFDGVAAGRRYAVAVALCNVPVDDHSIERGVRCFAGDQASGLFVRVNSDEQLPDVEADRLVRRAEVLLPILTDRAITLEFVDLAPPRCSTAGSRPRVCVSQPGRTYRRERVCANPETFRRIACTN